MKQNIYIGTSGWSFGHWKGVFYPENMPAWQYLEYYQRYFNCVEVNNTFYRLPRAETLSHWYASVPDDFIFAVKASRFITHMKKLNSPYATVLPFLRPLNLLAEKLGPVLFQLPPHWHCNSQRLERFLAWLPKDDTYVFEFRDSSWFNEAIYQLLKQHNAVWCIYDLDAKQSPLEVTADSVYLRLHGPAEAYCGKYPQHALEFWAKKISCWHEAGKQVYCFFNNDEAGYAVQNALQLKAMLAC